MPNFDSTQYAAFSDTRLLTDNSIARFDRDQLAECAWIICNSWIDAMEKGDEGQFFDALRNIPETTKTVLESLSGANQAEPGNAGEELPSKEELLAAEQKPVGSINDDADDEGAKTDVYNINSIEEDVAPELARFNFNGAGARSALKQPVNNINSVE